MARKQTLRKAVSKAQVNVMLNRDRPDFSSLNAEDENFDSLLLRAMNWLNEMYDADDLQKIAATEYPMAMEHPAHSSRQLGMFVFMKNEGAQFGPKQEQYMQELVSRLVPVAKTDVVKQERFDPVVHAQDTLEEMLMMQDFDLLEAERLLSKLGSRQAKQIDDHFQQVLQDLNKSDDDASYKKFLEKNIQSLHNMLLGKRERKTRTSRKPMQTRNAKVNQVKHLKDWKGISGLDPSRIIGSKMVVTFHTEHRVVNVYVGDNIGINGASIVGYDEKASMSKKIRDNKVDSLVGSVLSAGGPDRIKTLVGEINGKNNVPRPRFANEIIILKAM